MTRRTHRSADNHLRTESDLDPAREVRGEDSFDVARVAAWVRAHAAEPTGLAATPGVQQFTGGASNLTYLLSYPTEPGADRGRELILRRPPGGRKAKSAHDMRREYEVQQLLRPAFDYVPAMVAFCEDPSVLGSEFYVMERLKGRILRRDLPAGMALSAQQAHDLSRSYADRLIDLHQIDIIATGLDKFSRGSGYVGRQVAGWSERYRNARTNNVGSFEKIMGWLQANQPDDRGACLIHNDYRLDNLVLDPEDPLKIVGVLDWEMATVGDPLMDLGAALAYWVDATDHYVFQQFRQQPSNVSGMLTRAEIVAYYASRTGLIITPGQWRFYEVFGLFRLAAIAQQVYYRFFHGQTTNAAYKKLRLVVIVLEWRCHKLIDSGLLANVRAACVPLRQLLCARS